MITRLGIAYFLSWIYGKTEISPAPYKTFWATLKANKKGAFAAISKDGDLLGCFHSYSGDDGWSKSALVCLLYCFSSLLLDLQKASSCLIIPKWNKVCGSNICCVWSYMAKKFSEKKLNHPPNEATMVNVDNKSIIKFAKNEVQNWYASTLITNIEAFEFYSMTE